MYAHQGDIGRHADEAIARAIHWDREPVALLSALVASGWVDACPCHRLRVHDWPAHADQTVHRVLANRKLTFAACYGDASIILASCYPYGQHETSQPLAVSRYPGANTGSQYREPLAGSQEPRANGGAQADGGPSEPGLLGPPNDGGPPHRSKAKPVKAVVVAPATDGGETWPTREALDDYAARYGAGSIAGSASDKGRILGPLTALVRAQAKADGRSRADTWAVTVRPAWRRYLHESTHPSPSAADFQAHFADWRPGGRGSRAGPPSSAALLREAIEAMDAEDAQNDARGRGPLSAVAGGRGVALPDA